MARSRATSHATAQMTLSLGKPLAQLVESEAALMHMHRAQFLRALISRHQGTMHLERSPDAPPIKPLTARKHPLVKIQLAIQPELLKYLHGVANKAGNISRSAVIAMWILDWCGIDPVRQGDS